jgi:hypothetical protein
MAEIRERIKELELLEEDLLGVRKKLLMRMEELKKGGKDV